MAVYWAQYIVKILTQFAGSLPEWLIEKKLEIFWDMPLSVNCRFSFRKLKEHVR